MLIHVHCFVFQYGDHLTQLENNIKIAQKKALEQADNGFLDVREEGYEDDYMLEPIPMEVDPPGEDEWDPDHDVIGKKKKSSKPAGGSKTKSGPWP